MESGHEEEIDNTERGCGHLKHNAAYLRSDVTKLSSVSGSIPPFVKLDTPIEYREHGDRGAILPGWKPFPGVEFSLAYHNEGYTTTPVGQIEKHQRRLEDLSFDGDHYGDITVAQSHDLLMSVGATNWPTPEEYIEECRELGLNLKIPSSPNHDPPVVNPFVTRCWVIHPNGIEEGRAAIIGYAVLTRCIFTTGKNATGIDPDIPKYAQDWARTGKVHLATPGPEVSDEDGRTQPGIADFKADADAVAPSDEEDEDEDPFERAERMGAYQTGPNPLEDDEEDEDSGGETVVPAGSDTDLDVVPADSDDEVGNFEDYEPGQDGRAHPPVWGDSSYDGPDPGEWEHGDPEFWVQYDIPIDFATAQNNRLSELQKGSTGTGATESTARHLYVLEAFEDGRLSREAGRFLCLGEGDRPDRPNEPATNPKKITCETCLKRMERWKEGQDE